MRRAHEAANCGDFEDFKKLSDSAMTTFMPEAPGQLVQGLKCHEFVLQATKSDTKTRNHTVVNNLHIRVLGPKAAVTTCSILRQSAVPGSIPVSFHRILDFVDNQKSSLKSVFSEDNLIWRDACLGAEIGVENGPHSQKLKLPLYQPFCGCELYF